MSQIDDSATAYAKLLPDYEAFSIKMRSLIEDLVRSRSIHFQIIESRAKTLASFEEKVARPGKSYTNAIDEISDLCGCRVITYYLEDVKLVSDILKSEFHVLEEELSHQPPALQADRFGYLSAHYVVKLNEERANLTEWASYKSFRAEIQIRTVIQHAWSAVSHALQYKAETEVPSALRRRLYRIAGLFELADEEFGSIRDQRISLRKSASKAIAAGEKNISLSNASITEFLNSWTRRPFVIRSAQEAGFSVDQSAGE